MCIPMRPARSLRCTSRPERRSEKTGSPREEAASRFRSCALRGAARAGMAAQEATRFLPGRSSFTSVWFWLTTFIPTLA